MNLSDITRFDTAPWYDEVMECPRCGEIELHHVATVGTHTVNRVQKQYVCKCGHEENHWVKR